MNNNAFEIIGVGQLARTYRHLEPVETWFKDVLGLRHLFSFEQLAFFDCGGTRLMLTEKEDPPANESLIYFRVADVKLSYETLQERGVEFIQAPEMIHQHEDGTEEWMAFFKDPEDRPLAIMS